MPSDVTRESSSTHRWLFESAEDARDKPFRVAGQETPDQEFTRVLHTIGGYLAEFFHKAQIRSFGMIEVGK